MKRLLILSLAVVGAASANAQLVINASNVAFTDISATGTSVGTPTDDSEHVISGTALTAAGWAGNALLAGNVDVRVGNNGGIIWGNSIGDTFTSATEIGFDNSTSFMTMAASNATGTGNGGVAPRQFLAVHWDDLFPAATGFSINWQVIGGNLIIQWTGTEHFDTPAGQAITFQMVARGSGSTLVDYVYNDTFFTTGDIRNDAGSATIGYKNWGGPGAFNDVEFGVGGGDAGGVFKVGGWVENGDPALTHSVSLSVVPEPASMAALGLGAIALLRRRRKSA